MIERFSAVTVAILLLILGNFSASVSDVAVKLLDSGISVFQYMFIRQLLCFFLLLPFWLKTSKVLRQIGHIKITLLRAHLVLAGSGFVMVALTYLPLTTANAVFYTAPLIMLPLSAWLLTEKIAIGKVIATLTGFIGVLVILRPSQFHWAAIFALACAFTLALYNVLVKKLPIKQPVAITLFWTSLLSLPLAGVLAILFWQPLSGIEFMLIFASALCTLGYHASAISAYKRAATSHIALAEYSGLIFVTFFGIIWFDEYPDTLTIIGILLILLPMFPLRRKQKMLAKELA